MEMYGIGNKTVIVYQIRPDNVVEYVHSVTLNPNWVAGSYLLKKSRDKTGQCQSRSNVQIIYGEP